MTDPKPIPIKDFTEIPAGTPYNTFSVADEEEAIALMKRYHSTLAYYRKGSKHKASSNALYIVHIKKEGE